ncbi:BC1872 family protein [Neobacillus sp. LXY-4]|uniref:BC1872 family protein n=1 Tax=Neobacillus sp. LXY-4 TaxID=3379826 RepID=UPI003EDF05FB
MKKSTMKGNGHRGMNKVDIIARRILGWKLNRWDRWYDHEKGIFIHDSEFQPQENLDHAMIIVKRLEKFGFTYTIKGDSEVCFNEVSATGGTLAEAITNAAYEIADNSSIADEWL